jgi:hemerythrin-like domain-containing protein
MQKEESIFLHLLPHDAYLLRMSEEHIVIKKLFNEKKEWNEGALLDLASFIEQHIRFEERELFPHLERTLTTIQLQESSQQLVHAPVCKIWHEEFWVRKTK